MSKTGSHSQTDIVPYPTGQGDLPERALKKHVAAIHTDGQLSLLQRKLSNVLLLNAYDQLLTQPEHEIDEKTLCVMLGYDSNDRKPLKTALKALASVQAEWNILDDNQDEVEWGVASLLSHAVLSKGRCRYGYAPALAQKLYNPAIYASINMKVQRRFKSGHALALYENCYRFKSIGTTGWWNLKTFRRLMGVDGSEYYAQYKHLNAKIIKPVTKEINTHSDILITPEVRRKGRSVDSIRFKIEPSRQIPLLDINDADGTKDTTVYKRLIALGIAHKLAQSWIAEHGETYVQAKLDLVDAQKKTGKIVSVSGFLTAAISQDYKTSGRALIKQAKDKALENRRARIDKKAAQTRQSSKLREDKKANRLADNAKAVRMFEALNPEDKAMILESFNALLTKDYMRADFKTIGISAPSVIDQFTAFMLSDRKSAAS